MQTKNIWTSEPLDLTDLSVIDELDTEAQSELAEVLKFELLN